jgi:formylglycine-generating enzyme required for sulfatase activity
MAVLFVSHSSKDDAIASALEAWLHASGFDDTFVDHQNLAGGAKWREELRASAGACRVVVCLVTENWLASNECFNEFRAAWYMGKRIIPLFLLPPTPDLSDEAKQRFGEVRAEDQGIDLNSCLKPEQVLNLEANPKVASRLKTGLRAAGALSRIGLDPAAFEIDRKQRPTPFPGLASFGDADADAALFYGRSREIAEALEELRKVRAERDLRPFVILGASGAGKSSLLKAGIIPRLRRERPGWLPLHAFRPGTDPLLNFAEALSRTLADFGKIDAPGIIRDRLLDAWLKAERSRGELTPSGRSNLDEALEAEGHRLRDAAARGVASILISVDQAEEMTRDDGKSGEALGDYLRAALAASSTNWQLAFTIRTDSLPELQSHRRFQDLKARGYDLRAVPAYRFESVVEGPAKRYGVDIDKALVDAVIGDAPTEDALPLLAFALQRLWRQYAASGVLTKHNYDKVGGLKGLIEDAAERALRGLAPEEDTPLQSGPPPKRRVDLAAATFVPALAQITDQGTTIRRIAAWNGFSDEQQELLLKFDQWRLVVRKGTDANGGTVEVVHEALFREWARLQGWLEPERARLEALRSLQVDALTWDRNGRDVAFLNHRDRRLAEARTLAGIDSYRKRLGTAELDYLGACETAERLARRRARRVQVIIYVLLFGIIAGLVGWIEQAFIRDQVNWYVFMRPYMLAHVRPYVLSAAAEQALTPLETFHECDKNCPEMVVVPAGHFTMGSPDTEVGRYDDENPQHPVTIAKPFAVSKFVVTFAEWDTCASVGGCPQASDSGFGRGTRPAINISWDDAEKYVAWLSTMTGKPYRLLTEAEWEYAARAGTTTAYFWGDEIGVNNANCHGCGSQWDNRETAPVGSFKQNAFDLFDMHGNVWEWVQDCYHLDYNGAPQDGAPWLTADCSRRVRRGGAWGYIPRILRSADRGGDSPVNRSAFVGFRIARTLNP